MGNAIASRGSGRVKVMKLDGEIIKFKAPVTVEQVVANCPDHVIMHSDAVRHLGIRAKPLDKSEQLKPKNLYFLLQMPRIENPRAPTRVRSDINLSAKSRLEALLLARRSNSDISVFNSFRYSASSNNGEDGTMRVKIRVTKAQLAQLTAGSNTSSETTEKILDLVANEAHDYKNVVSSHLLTEKSPLASIPKTCNKAPRNHVRFSSQVQTPEVF